LFIVQLIYEVAFNLFFQVAVLSGAVIL